MSGVIQKAMGPVMAAVGAASEYFFPGNPYGIAAITQGAGQSLGQQGLFGSLLGGSQQANATPPNPPPSQTATAFGAPPTPAIPTSSMTGFNLGAPPVQYAQQGGGAGAGGGSTDLINQAIAQALGGGAGGGGAFSQYQAA